MLGESLAGQERFDEAEPLVLEAYERLRSDREVLDLIKREARARVIDLYDAWGKPQQAAEWRAKLPVEQETVATDQGSPANDKQDE